MEYCEVLSELSDKIKSNYHADNVKIIKANYVNDIYCVFVKIKLQELIDTWSKINSTIAAEITPHLNTDYELWNLYLFFVSSETIPPDIKHSIEHNKFSSRKIVEDNINEDLNDNVITQLMSKNITNHDFETSEFDNRKIDNTPYQNDSEIYKLIESSYLRFSDKAFKDDLYNLYEEIVKEAKNEI